MYITDPILIPFTPSFDFIYKKTKEKKNYYLFHILKIFPYPRLITFLAAALEDTRLLNNNLQ